MSTSSFFGIELGKRSLQNFKTALEVTGHNINNVATKGYSRQRVVMRTFDKPLEQPSLNRAERAGQIGQGAEITTVERIRDQFIDSKIMMELGTDGYWKTKSDYLKQLEAIYNEPGNANLRNDLDTFWDSWQEMAANPAERGTRMVLVERADRINNSINQMFNQMNGMRNNLNNLVENKVKRINDISNSIRDLNVEIVKQQALGQSPNDLLDRRDLLVDELSSLANVDIKSVDPDETMIYIGGRALIQGNVVSELSVERNINNEGMYDIYWKKDHVQVQFEGGELKALMELRDVDTVDAINDLDTFAMNLADSVNEIHRSGFGLNQETGIDFFTVTKTTPSVIGNFDINNDGQEDSTIMFKVSGINSVDSTSSIGSSGTLVFGNKSREGADVAIDYTAQMKVGELIDKINSSEANVSAYLDDKNRLVLKARGFDDYMRPSYFIKHIEDSGDFLVGITGVLNQSGAAGAYNWQTIDQVNQLAGDFRNFTVTPDRHPASAIAVNDIIRNDINYIAASKGIDTTGNGFNDKWNGIGDGSNALAIANLKTKEIMVDSKSTFNDFYTGSLAKIASRTETANAETEKQTVVMEYLEKLRQSVSGVNLDEEVAQMAMYQHGYNASARVVSVMDQLLDVVINRMGV